MIKLYPIHSGNFHLDGGAMFGVVPKTLWEKQVPANEKNLCNWAMRCLLVENTETKQLILIDTGIGNKQSEKFYGYYDLNGDHSLLSSLSNFGFAPQDITDVLLTHLHFDHVGGAVTNHNNDLIPTFPNAKYWVHSNQWLHALNPNPREKASFLTENYLPLDNHGVISFIEEGSILADCIEIRVFNGHTIGMIVPLISTGTHKIIYAADLIPSAAHIPVNYVMGYDIQPLITMEEKSQLLKEIIENDMLLFYEHDVQYEMSRVNCNDKGLYSKGETLKLSDIQFH